MSQYCLTTQIAASVSGVIILSIDQVKQYCTVLAKQRTVERSAQEECFQFTEVLFLFIMIQGFIEFP